MAHEDKQQEFVRFSAAQRFEHILVVVTFTVLGLTGIPQRYAGHAWAQTMLEWMGGIESVRIVHRIMATILMLECIYHGGVLSYEIFVLGKRLDMIPGLKDMYDAIGTVLHNLGLRKAPPKMPRFNFGEKAEYLAMVWGTLVMVLTGFMLWNPIATARLLPGAWIPAAKAAHSAEALLAVVSIVVWHMYNVHIKHFNKSMFTGKITRHEMEKEHGAELEDIEAGRLPVPPPAEIIEQRKRVFWPYAVVMTVILVAGLFLFISFEQSAIDTVPRLSAAGDAVDVDPNIGMAERGAALWFETGCDVCHGADARGTMGASFPIAGTSISFEAFANSVRRGPAEMPAFSSNELGDEDLAHLWVWLTSLNLIAD